MQNLLDAVRSASLPGLWSSGVRLARDGAVTFSTVSAGEVTARVRTPGRTVALTVTLYVESEEWSCDCNSPRDPCEHVSAAAIAFAKSPSKEVPAVGAGESGSEPIGTPTCALRLVYRLSRRDGILSLARIVVSADGQESP